MVPKRPPAGNVPPPQSAALVPVAHGRAQARAAAVIRDGLKALLAVDVTAWSDHGFTVHKQRTVRTVLVGALTGVPVHVKVFRADTLSDRARDALRGARGEREFRNLERIRELGLPTVEPLAHGMASAAGELRSFVVTRTLPAARPFDFALPTAVLAAAGRLLRSLHDTGTLPGDLHPGNLLVDAEHTLHLVDLTSIAHGGEPSLSQRAAALAFFCQALDGGALDPRARALLAGYRSAGTPLGASFPEALRRATHRWRARALPSFGRRSGRSCLHTELGERRRGIPRWYFHVGEGGLDATERARLQAFLEAPPPPTKTGRRGAVWLLDDVVVKRRDKGAAQKLWTAAYWLLFAGVDAPTPLALCTWRGQGFVFSRRSGPDSVLDELRAGALDGTSAVAAARRLGRSLGRLHAHGLRNRDLKLENLVREPGTDRVPMVDLDGVRRNAAPDHRGAGADLGRLLAAWQDAGEPGGAAARRTFLRAYLRSQRELLHRPPMARILQQAARRAGEWRQGHMART